ncbi:uncharacterized protein LOC141907711 [Tubulanus polymorphus]|uniref:uncharacterized protein LOC141907711 n=1 Tax=Tubulanus polymorphus TaxID=672921 RepID=UPI003DA22D30
MKVATVVLVVAAVLISSQSTAQAADLNLRETWNELVGHVKGLGQHAIAKLKETAQHVSNETLQKLINALSNGDTSSLGKRDLADVKETWADLVNHLKGLGQHTIDKLKEMSSTVSSATLAKLIDALKTGQGVVAKKRELDDDIEELLMKLKSKFPQVAEKLQQLKDKYPVVAEEVLSRYQELKDKLPVVVEKVLEIQSKLADKLQGHADNLKNVVGKATDQLKDILDQIKNGDARNKLASIFGKVKSTIGLAKREIDLVARQVEKEFLESYINELQTELLKQMPSLVSKRDAEEFRRAAGNKFKDFFNPHIQKIKEHIDNLGKLTNNHAGNVKAAVKDHLNQLQTKLQVHVDQMKQHGQTIVGHGKNAVDALKGAVTDILLDTFVKMSGTTIDAIGTIKDAIVVVTDHVIDAAGKNNQS